MRIPLSTVFSAAICVALMVMTQRTWSVEPDQVLIKQLRETIAIVRTSEPSIARMDAAMHLADLTRNIDPTRVDNKTLHELVALLNTSDDSVRDGVAASLGNIGPRAKIAIPKLLKILAEVECLPLAGRTSEGSVRYALRQMGVNPPAADCGAANQKKLRRPIDIPIKEFEKWG